MRHEITGVRRQYRIEQAVDEIVHPSGNVGVKHLITLNDRPIAEIREYDHGTVVLTPIDALGTALGAIVWTNGDDVEDITLRIEGGVR